MERDCLNDLVRQSPESKEICSDLGTIDVWFEIRFTFARTRPVTRGGGLSRFIASSRIPSDALRLLTLTSKEFTNVEESPLTISSIDF